MLATPFDFPYEEQTCRGKSPDPSLVCTLTGSSPPRAILFPGMPLTMDCTPLGGCSDQPGPLGGPLLPKSKIEALLWDNDGVLVDTEPLYLQANREILGGIGIELTENLYKEISLRQGRSVFELAADRGVDAAQIERLKVDRNARYTERIDEGVEVLGGVREALERFLGHLPMGIVTSSQREHFDRIHQETGLLGYFDFVLASGDYVRHKPHPEPYLAGAARHGYPPERCLAIEDTERGLAAAVAADMPCIVIPRPLSQAGNFASALHVLESAAELPRRVGSLLEVRVESCQ